MSKKAMFRRRLHFISQFALAKLRHSFTKWAAQTSQTLPNLMMSRDLLETYSVLKLVNVANRRKTNAMGFLPIRSKATAFFVWKKKAKVEFTSAYDGQYRLQKLLALSEICARGMKSQMAHFLDRCRLVAVQKIAKERALKSSTGK